MEGGHAHLTECDGRLRRAPGVRRFADVHRSHGPQGRQHRRPRQRENREGNIDMMLSLFGDAVVALLLIATISYAAVLNQRLSVLRNDRFKLEELVNGLTVAAQRAESGIAGLKAASEDHGQLLAKKIDDARTLRDDLTYLLERGSNIADRLARPIPAQTGG